MKAVASAVPPSPPAIQRKLAFYPFQVLGLVLILAIPMLAVLGVFGEIFAEVSVSNPSLVMQVTYTTQYRYQMVSNLEIAVQNVTNHPISTLTVTIDNNYLHPFSSIRFTPAITRVTTDDHEIELADVAPGETRMVKVELQAARYGEHKGIIKALADDLEPVEISISTMIFP